MLHKDVCCREKFLALKYAGFTSTCLPGSSGRSFSLDPRRIFHAGERQRVVYPVILRSVSQYKVALLVHNVAVATTVAGSGTSTSTQ